MIPRALAVYFVLAATMTDQVPDNVNAAMWTLQRLTKAPKLSAATLKAF
jgi:hypothetical protein